MSLEYINNRINEEICDDIINKLKDIHLIDEYKKCKSVKKEINKLKLILEKHDIDIEKRELIINDYMLELVPAGTKGVIRGNIFNTIVKNIIKNMNLDNNIFEYFFEKQCIIHMTSEIPDWYILNKLTKKILIGMNQLDLWQGGHQLNRGSRYLIDNIHNTNDSKLLCIVCNRIKFNNTNTKAYNLFKIGYENNTLCYIKNLKSIIIDWFTLNTG